MKPFILAAVFFVATSCAQSALPPVRSGVEFRTQETFKNVEIGDRLTESGHFLEASFYYEAALFFADDELVILPKLIATQVKSDRLRAARSNLKRLIELRGEIPRLRHLVTLLDTYAPYGEREILTQGGAP